MTLLNPNIPFGFCQCGCGEKTSLVAKSSFKRGLVKGQPMRFIVGHVTRYLNPPLGRTWSPAELGYLAGLIDGEGSISIIRHLEKSSSGIRHLRHRLILIITNSNENMMKWITDRFRGRIHHIVKPTGTIVYTWHCGDYALEEILGVTSPYMVSKKPQAELALAFRKGFYWSHGGDQRQSTHVSPEQINHRDRCWEQMAALNIPNGKTRKGFKAKMSSMHPTSD